MDLAKIRKKSLQALKESGDGSSPAPFTSPELTKTAPGASPAAFAVAGTDFFQNQTCFSPDVAVETSAQLITAFPSHHAEPACTPLKVLLAGRSSAGCDDASMITDDASSAVVAESGLEFLCFRVSNEIYGINIMDIKEIIKPREVTEVPRAPVFVSGVLSLRGTIIPVIDMRIRLGLLREEPTGKERIVVIKSKNSFSGLLVDEVTQVVRVPLDAVEDAPAVLDGIDRDFIRGLGRSDGRFIIIVNLENIADINLY